MHSTNVSRSMLSLPSSSQISANAQIIIFARLLICGSFACFLTISRSDFFTSCMDRVRFQKLSFLKPTSMAFVKSCSSICSNRLYAAYESIYCCPASRSIWEKSLSASIFPSSLLSEAKSSDLCIYLDYWASRRVSGDDYFRDLLLDESFYSQLNLLG